MIVVAVSPGAQLVVGHFIALSGGGEEVPPQNVVE
jgi:hypothetical protein